MKRLLSGGHPRLAVRAHRTVDAELRPHGARRSGRSLGLRGVLHVLSTVIGILAVVSLSACGGRVSSQLVLRADFSPAARVGDVTATLHLASDEGQPLVDAKVRVEANMNHAGMVPVFADAEPTEEPGVYVANFEFTMAGDWYLAVTAQLPDGTRAEGTLPVPAVARKSGSQGSEG